MEATLVIIVFLFIVCGVILMRHLGAWMFRIDEVIKTNRDILEQLKKME